MSEVSQAIDLIYKERKEFIIIGLTGRTGSGCSTASSILENTFDQIAPPKPVNECCKSNKERKYRIVYNFAKHNWVSFIKIQITNIITSFILEYNFDTFIKYIMELNMDIKLDAFCSIKEKFEELNRKKIQLKAKIDQEEPHIKNLKDENLYKFYFKEIPAFTEEIRNACQEIEKDLFTFIYQIIGNNIRISGDAYSNDFNPKNIYRLSQRTNMLIKILRQRNYSNNSGVLVVIDALRNPFEINFFKDRYSSFYLFSINTEEKSRRGRLVEKGLNIQQIEKIDEKEYDVDLSDKAHFYSLNIKGCLQLADIHIYNPNEKNEKYCYLKKQLIKYVSLIMHPGLVGPSHSERCRQAAYNAKVNSGCLSRQVGAVVTDKNYSIKSIGWNSCPEGQIPCNLRDLKTLFECNENNDFSDYEKHNERYYDFLNNKQKEIKEETMRGRLFPYCFRDAYNAMTNKTNQVHTRSLHAEENAFLQIAKNGGVSIKGGYLFTTASPCELCAKKAYHLGISKIYYIDPYPGISIDHILKQGNNPPKMKLFHGAIGKAYQQIFTPLMPYKDELYMMAGFRF